MSRRERGLTLLEMLVTMLLMSMAFAMTAILVRNFSNTSNHLAGKEATQQASLLLLGVAAELEEAFEVTTPAVGDSTPASEVVLRKYAPTSKRLELATISSTWAPDYVLSVRYCQDGEELVRQTTYPDGSHRDTRLAGRLSGFSATRVSPRSLEVRATFRESKKLETVSALAYRWGD